MHSEGPPRRWSGGPPPPWPSVYFSAMAAAQQSCPEVAEMMSSTTLQITTQAVGNDTLLGDVSTGVFRPLVPIQHREAVFQSLHSIHHPGVRMTRRLIAALFCWPQMAKAITLMARAYLYCQRGKVHKHVHLQPAEIPVPHRRFAHIHVNLDGPLPPSRGPTCLFTIFDRTSRWPEAIPLSSITTADCARALFVGWISVFGVPDTITSDRAQFTSALWAGLCSLLNMGDAQHQGLIQGGQRVFTSGGSIRLTTGPARPVRQHRRVAVAVFPQRPTNHHERPPATADAAQLSSSSIYTSGGADAGPLRSGPPGRCAAATVPDLQWPPSAGAVNTFLSPRDGGENRQGVHTLPESGPDASRYGASQAAVQGSPR
jgi:hypothetical protein